MWNITEDDVQQAIGQIKGRRDAIQARYDSEIKKIEADFADLETFERLAVKLAADYRGDAGPSATGTDSRPATEQAAIDPSPAKVEAPIITISERSAPPRSEPPAEQGPETDPAGAPKGSSRWRMRLGAGEASR